MGSHKKVKVAHTRLPSVGFRSWSRFLAVSLQATWVINPAVGCHYFWRRGVVVSGVRQWTKLTHVGPGYNWDGWPSSGGYTISGCNQPTRSTQPCIPPGSLNRVLASAGVKAGMSPLLRDPMWHVSSRSGEASRELLYSVYFTFFTFYFHGTNHQYWTQKCMNFT